MTYPDVRGLGRAMDATRAAAGVRVPQPPSRWKTRVLLPLSILLAAGGVFVYSGRMYLSPGVSVVAAAVIPRSATGHVGGDMAGDGGDTQTETESLQGASKVTVQAPGWIEPDPYVITIPALAEGVVKEVLVLEGESIAEGDVIAKMVEDDALLEMRAAEARLATVEAELELAKQAIATAESRVAIEKAMADQLRDDIERKRPLAGNALPAGDYRQLELRLVGLQASVATAELMVSERKAEYKRTQASVMEAQVELAKSQLRLQRMTITSPHAGTVLSRFVSPGSRLGGTSRFGEEGMESAVIRVYDPMRLQVRVDVPLADATKVSVGTRATVTTDALADMEFAGVVTRVVHEANIQRNTVQFKVHLEAPSLLLKPEMLTRVKFHASARGNSVGVASGSGGGRAGRAGDSSSGLSLLVHVEALMAREENGAEVWVVQSTSREQSIHRRRITLARYEDDAFVIATSGLLPTDKVVLNPEPAFKEGQRVRVKLRETPSGAEELVSENE